MMLALILLKTDSAYMAPITPPPPVYLQAPQPMQPQFQVGPPKVISLILNRVSLPTAGDSVNFRFSEPSLFRPL